MGSIVLCADAESLRHLDGIGLAEAGEGECPWLETLSLATEARAAMAARDDVDEVWVASADDMDALNLAAALKHDRAALGVFLVALEPTGSVLSRAKAAGVDGALSRRGMASRFSRERSRRMSAQLPVIAEAAPVDPGAPVDSSAVAPAALPEGSGLVVSVMSGSGGAGKSTMAVLLAHRASARGSSCVLIDGDLQFGDLHHLLGCDGAPAVEVVASDSSLLDTPAMRDAPVALVAAPRRLEDAETYAAALARVVEQAAARFDVVVVNTGASWAEYHAMLIERSTCTLLLVDQRSSSIRSCRRALDLCTRCGIAAGSFVYALNRCSRTAPFTSIDVSCALQGALVLEVAEGGSIVEELLDAGRAEELAASGNELCVSVDRLLDEMLPASAGGEVVPSAAGEEREGGVFQRMRRRRTRAARAAAGGGTGMSRGAGAIGDFAQERAAVAS